MSNSKCQRSPLLSPSAGGEAISTVRLVAPLGDRGCGWKQQITYDMTAIMKKILI